MNNHESGFNIHRQQTFRQAAEGRTFIHIQIVQGDLDSIQKYK